ncbi:hypothetical protein MKX03_009240, partial [Papaver bracteatum]
MDEFYPKPFTGIELLPQKIYSLGRFQARVAEKLEEDLLRPPQLVEDWISFFSAEIKEILAMERRLCDKNSAESLGLLQSVVQQSKTMKKYIADQIEPTLFDSDSVSDFTPKPSISSTEEVEYEDESLDCKLLPPFCFEEDDDSATIYSHEPKTDSIDAVSFQFKEIDKAKVSYFDSKKHAQVVEVSSI